MKYIKSFYTILNKENNKIQENDPISFNVNSIQTIKTGENVYVYGHLKKNKPKYYVDTNVDGIDDVKSLNLFTNVSENIPEKTNVIEKHSRFGTINENKNLLKDFINQDPEDSNTELTGIRDGIYQCLGTINTTFPKTVDIDRQVRLQLIEHNVDLIFDTNVIDIKRDPNIDLTPGALVCLFYNSTTHLYTIGNK